MQDAAPTRSARQHFRFTIVPLAALITLAAVLVVGAVVVPQDSGQLGGDFPAFYAAGTIVAEQGYDNLYDPAVQSEAQQGLTKDDGGFLFFAYPPFVATGYSWLTPLGYRTAYIVQMLMMGAAAVGTILLLRPFSPLVRRYPAAVVATVVLFEPLLASLIGGQNTALTMLLFAAAARAELDGKPVLAGIAIGLLAYKPQYGVPLAAVAALSQRWRVVMGTALAWAGLYAAGVVAAGVAWIGPWWQQATAFRDVNATANGRLFVSWPGFIEHLFSLGGTAGRVLGLVIGAAGVGAIAWLWHRSAISVSQRYAVAAVGLTLIAPQSLFYESGIVAVSLILLAATDGRVARVAAATWVAGWLYVATQSYLNTGVLVIALSAVLGYTLVAVTRRGGFDEAVEAAP